MAIQLSPDFREFFAFANDNDVQYLVIGGYAVAVHGSPRYTRDIDVWVERSEGNSERILQTLTDFGFGSLQISADTFQQRDQIVQLGYPPLRIDLLTDVTGLDFGPCYERRCIQTFSDVSVPFISVADLITNKKATGRAQDLADVEKLEKQDPD